MQSKRKMHIFTAQHGSQSALSLTMSWLSRVFISKSSPWSRWLVLSAGSLQSRSHANCHEAHTATYGQGGIGQADRIETDRIGSCGGRDRIGPGWIGSDQRWWVTWFEAFSQNARRPPHLQRTFFVIQSLACERCKNNEGRSEISKGDFRF